MINRSSVLRTSLAVGLFVVILLGCSHTPPTRTYILGPLPEKGTPPTSEPCVTIGFGPVKIPEYLERSGIVTRLSPNELAVADFNKWGAPLGETFPRVLAEDLSSFLCTKAILLFPWRGAIPLDYRVYVEVIRMDGKLGESAVLNVGWAIMGGAEKKEALVTKRSSYQEPTRGPEHGDYVAAQSRNVASLSRDIAEAIKALPR